jgi:dual specificity protein kinase YAK1
MNNRKAFIDFVQGLLNLNPHERWTPQQARLHPFVLGEPLKKPFVPPPHLGRNVPSSVSIPNAQPPPPPPPQNQPPPSPQDSQDMVKRPYGGLPTTPQRNNTRTYDAASYQRHLEQQQAYSSAAQQAAYQQATQSKNPYALPDSGPTGGM